MKKRRTPGSSALPSANGCPSSPSSPGTPALPSAQPSLSQPLLLPRDHPGPGHQERLDLELLLGEVEGEREREQERETAILDDGESSPLRPTERSCCSRTFSPGPQSPCSPLLTCATNGHCLDRREAAGSKGPVPKHHTLPVSRTSPPPLLEPCLSHPDLLWDRGRCLHRSCSQTPSRPHYSYPAQGMGPPLSHHPHPHPHPHALTLPVSPRGYCPGEVCSLYHYPTHTHAHSHATPPPPRALHQSLPPSPYHELRFSTTGPGASTSCPCPDCARLRRDEPTLLRLGQSESHHPWTRETAGGFGYRREAHPVWDREADSPWEREQEAEFWRRHSAMATYRHCHSPQARDLPPCLQDGQQSATVPSGVPSPFPSPHSSSSGYHTPQAVCPCSPVLHSMPPNRESHGYSSGGQSRTASPLPATPSPQRADQPEGRLSQAQRPTAGANRVGQQSQTPGETLSTLPQASI